MTDQVSQESRGSSERTPPGPPDLSTLDQVRPSFANLSEEQWTQVRRLGLLLVEWNERVNLISRKDIGNVMQNHVVPCLAMAKALGLEDEVEGETSMYCYQTVSYNIYIKKTCFGNVSS